MGWMHDTLEYLSHDPVHRRWHHDGLTFRAVYAFTENFVLPLSHDEVTHGKRSLLEKMPGDDWQKFAGLRLLLGYQYTLPGKKLLFMGSEIAQRREWDHDSSIDWHLLEYAPHAGIFRFVSDLNALYRSEPSLYELDCEPGGFEWVLGDDAANSVLVYIRRGRSADSGPLLVVCNFTPVPRTDFPIALPAGGWWRELLNSDAEAYGGSGIGNLGQVQAHPVTWEGGPSLAYVTVPPLAVVVLKREDEHTS
jgi:1,4-alpha-glucan branching enzyme